MVRILRIGGSFAIVLVAYWAYALVAVPLIEPPADRQSTDPLSQKELEDWARGTKERWRRELAGLFPPGAWELEDPKILEIGQVKLLLRNYATLDDGKSVEIRPCTMIFTPDGPAAEAHERRRRSVILEAPQGALLEFDRPFDPSRAKVGRLESGKLKGRITIRSGGRSPGPEDDLMVVTRDLDLNEERIWTPHAVDFRLGANYGRGRQMRIKLLADDQDEPAKRQGPNVAGIELVEISQLEQLHLHFSEGGALPGVPATADGRAGQVKPDLEADLPIEVTCRGAFRFDLIQQVATFEDQVDVLRVHPKGPSDQLNCETLSVYFARPRSTVPTGAKDAPDEPRQKRSREWALQPRRIEARGDPVVIRAPSQQIDARGQRLEYDFSSGRIVLDGTEEVFLKQGPNEIHARSLQYESAGSGRLGQVVAEGPGWLRGQMTDKLGQKLEARWNEQLRLRPHEQQHVISLTGGAELNFGGLGRLTAAEIHFWLLELPPAGKDQRAELRPDRMLAQRDVRLDSSQLSGNVDQLNVWFEQAPRREPGSGRTGKDAALSDAGPPPDGAPGSSQVTQQLRWMAARGLVQSMATSGSLGSSLLSPAGQLAAAPPPQHFEIVGHLLQARVLLSGKDLELAELTIEGNVRLTETRSAQPDEQPLIIRGELIHVVDAGQPSRAVTVTGNPAHFEGRGLGLTGSNINLDCGANQLWIDGPGWMDLPLDRDLEGQLLRDPGQLRVQWQERMAFDGRTVRFQRAVVAASRHGCQQSDLYTEALEVGFLHPIRFAEVNEQPDRPEVERVVCHGTVFMENRSFDQKLPSSLDRMQVADLNINRLSGETTASGPGWMTSVRRGSLDLLSAPGGESPAADPPPATGSDQNQLTYLNVRFQGPVLGNLHNREMTFRDQVRTTYGPVDSWQAAIDPDDPDALGPRGVLLSCQELQVTEMPQPTGKDRAVELAASGNVVVEGRTFTARAPRMTYADAKQLLILEGTGRTDAMLYHQKHVGAPFSEVQAHKILYWRSTGQVHFEGTRSLKSS